MKFVAKYISPVGLFYAIFRLTDFSSEPFDFSSLTMGSTGSAQRALSFIRGTLPRLVALQVPNFFQLV